MGVSPLRLASPLLALALGACQLAPDPSAGEAAAQCDQARATAAQCRQRLSAAEGARDALRESCSGWQEQLSSLGAQLARVEARLEAEPDRESRDAPDPAAEDCEPLPPAPGSKLLVGRREQVWIEDMQLELPARIDTGAETASLDARHIEEFERDGDAWVRFDMVHPKSGEMVSLERPVARVVRIIQSTSDRGERRVVIELGIVMGNQRQLAEFTLSDRSHLDYQVLVGRNILRDLMIVDVGQVDIAPPRLPGEAQ